MIRRDRQGWRVLIVLSRLAVAGILFASGPPGLSRPLRVYAQSDPPTSPHPPPPGVSSRPPDPTSPTKSTRPPADSGQPPGPHTNDTVAAQPTPVPHLASGFDSPLRIALPVPPSLERLTTRRNSLNQFLHKDRRHRLLLTRGDQALSGGDADLALLHFQALLDATTDAFYWPSDSLEPRGARSTAQGRLQTLSPVVCESYQRLHGPEARALLREAIAENNDRLLLEILRRYRLTDAGREAMIRELLFAFDRGQMARAGQFARLLAEDLHYQRHLTPQLQTLIGRLADGSFCDSCAANEEASLGTSPISPPALRPIWTRSLIAQRSGSPVDDSASDIAGVDRFVKEAILRWVHEHEDRQLPLTTANQATVVDDLLLMRDFSGVQALHLPTGRLVWSYQCAGSLVAAAQQGFREETRGGGSPPLSFHTHFAARGSRGRLSTDRQRVYLIDSHMTEDSQQSNAERPVPQQASNRLVALRLSAPEHVVGQPEGRTPQTAWARGFRGESGSESLAEHFFLGPPLPVDERLFVLSESDRRLHCTALNAQTGETCWQQPIALVEQSVDWDAARQMMVCSPVFAGSVIVCPTEVGVVVGIDPLAGDLLWIYDHIDDDQRHAAGRWSSSSQRVWGSTEFPSRMLSYQDRLYYLPFRSRFIHCLDARTGRLLWKQDRREALGLSAISDERLIVTGPRYVIALSPSDGSQLWKTTCPEPAGQGLVAEQHYLLPIRDGRSLMLSLDDGTITGSRFGKLLHELAQPPEETPASEPSGIQLVGYDDAEQPRELLLGDSGGNLLAADKYIVMATPTSVSVFPQARPLLQTLTTDAGHDGFAPRHRLEAAMLHLLLGESVEAKHRLQQVLEAPASIRIQQTASRLWREILFKELAVAADPGPILDQLTMMSGDDPDYLRLQVSRIDAELKLGNRRRLIDAIGSFSQTNIHADVHPEEEADLRVRASDYVADRLAFAHRNASIDVREALEAYVSSVAANSDDLADRERLLSLFGDWPQIAPLRNDVAEAYLEAGQLQRAELLLLTNRTSPSRPAAAHARRLLTNLYASQGLQREAATNLSELATDYRSEPTGNGLTGQEFWNQFSLDDPVKRVVRRRRSVPLPAYHVRITEHTCDDQCVASTGCQAAAALQQHDRIRRKFLVGVDSTLAVIDRGNVPGDRNHSQIALLNRETGRVHGSLKLPSAYWQLSGSGARRCGQLLPTCGRTAHGLSLLEQRTLWSTQESTAGHSRDKVKLGPLGPDYCVLQTPRRLSVIDPGTGNVLWERSNLPPNIGLLTNEATGIIGDAATLTIFGADQKAYTVYRMRSGSTVRHGQLDVSSADARRYRHAIGAKLVHLDTKGPHPVLRIWDAETDRILLEETLHEELFCPIGSGSRYALVNAAGRLLVIDVTTGHIDLNVPLAEEQLQDVTDLVVAADRDQFFVNLMGCSDDSSSETSAATDEVEIPGVRIQGRLLAVSRAGRVLWQKPVPEAVLLTNTECSMPILTLVSRVRDSHSRQSSRLRIDVLDARSGETLARRDDLLRTRIVRSAYQYRPGQLTLVGLNSQIEIEFGPRRREFLIHAEAEEPGGSVIR